MVLEAGKNYKVDAQIKSPIGWAKVEVNVACQEDMSLTGDLRIMGIRAEITEGKADGNTITFSAHPKLPFGVLDVTGKAEIAEDGSVKGTADAPHHKPMEIKGSVEEVA